MNKRGESVFLRVMIFVMLFVTLIQLVGPMKDEIIRVRNPSNLDCDNVTISTSDKSTCILADFSLFYFFGMALFAAGGIFTVRFVAQRIKGE